MQKYDNKLRDTSFRDYDEYMQFVFNCVNTALDQYIDVMKTTYASEQGGYKSILYPTRLTRIQTRMLVRKT